MAGEIGLSADSIVVIPLAMLFGAIAALLAFRRPLRHCTNCGAALPACCDEQAACNRRRDDRELQRSG